MISLAIFGLPTLPIVRAAGTRRWRRGAVLASLIRFDLVWGVSREWLKLAQLRAAAELKNILQGRCHASRKIWLLKTSHHHLPMIERVNSAQFAIYLAAAAAGETEIEGRIIIKQKSQLAAAAETRRRPRLKSSQSRSQTYLRLSNCCVRGSWSHVERVEITN